MNPSKRAINQMLWTGVTLFPTFVCNFSCPFCAFSADLNQHRDELTLDEIETIARGLGRVLVLHIGGGEPFIRPDLPEVIAAFARHTGVKKVEIPTNGWSAERIGKQVRRILELSPGLLLNVRISLDGIGALHDRVRARPGSYKAAVETLRALQAMAGEQAGLSCGVCQTITAHNQEAALSTYRTIRDDLKPDALVVNVCRDGSQEDRVSLDVVPERYAEVIGEMNADVASGAWWNYPKKRFLQSAFLNSLHATVWDLIAQELASGRPAVRCAAGATRSLVVYSTGEAAFCELGSPVGNLRDHGLSVRRLLATSAARDALKALKRCDKRHEICWHTSAPDPRLNPGLALRVLRRAVRLAISRARAARFRPHPAA
jgi:MoaA/NifB/PqqE/SkfB family radical SAM enzyme